MTLLLLLIPTPPPPFFYTLSLHDALPIFFPLAEVVANSFRLNRGGGGTLKHLGVGLFFPELWGRADKHVFGPTDRAALSSAFGRSEEHTSELQSLRHLVCRLLLEKKNKEY